jgi:hypothetical protein
VRRSAEPLLSLLDLGGVARGHAGLVAPRRLRREDLGDHVGASVPLGAAFVELVRLAARVSWVFGSGRAP